LGVTTTREWRRKPLKWLKTDSAIRRLAVVGKEKSIRQIPYDSANARVIKRSLVIAGHRTSVSLEDAFWRRLRAIAAERGLSLNGLAAMIDASRGGANLSSAIRVFVLEAEGERPSRPAGDGAAHPDQ
jgi:predicted DNA-binding ribbon-helix-helix protein